MISSRGLYSIRQLPIVNSQSRTNFNHRDIVFHMRTDVVQQTGLVVD